MFENDIENRKNNLLLKNCPYCGLYMEGSDEESLIKRWNDREKNNYDKS